jgi:hypothetical protein
MAVPLSEDPNFNRNDPALCAHASGSSYERAAGPKQLSSISVWMIPEMVKW